MQAFLAVLDKVTLADLLTQPHSVVAMPKPYRLTSAEPVPGLPDAAA
jgi:Rrf2 family nitric oxide-sensitive transcriptional repressor